MADPFEPKFVDLVRNFTTTTGTGNFVLGSAVNGFTSFAGALQSGDSFYYSTLGVDKPSEREVGRGTLQANGTISRDPINGVKTNFTSGIKTISLIAAAEWFTTIQLRGAGGGGGAALAESKSALAGLSSTAAPALLTENGCEGLFVFDPANVSAAVTADPRQGIYVPRASDPTGASGAWVRRAAEPKLPGWFGAKGDGVTDDHAALQAWLDSGGVLRLPAREYYSSQSLRVRKCVHLTGASYGFDVRIPTLDDMPGSRIRFAPGVNGLEIQCQTTLTDVAAVLAAGSAAWTQEGAAHSLISDIALIGPNNGAASNGVILRTIAHLENVQVTRFNGKGFDVVATSDVADGNDYGNANGATLTKCHAKENGSHGFHVRGRDANCIKLDTINAMLNGGWGILDESLLGNAYVNPHLATNTSGAIKAVGAVSASSFVKPYIESGLGNNCEIGGPNTVIGGDVSPVNVPGGAPPASFGGYGGSVNQLRFTWNWTVDSPIAGVGYAYRHANFGMVVQGEGSAADVGVLNKSGNVAFYVPTGTTQTWFEGAQRVNGSVALAGNQSFPGASSGTGYLYHSNVNGLVLYGEGTSFDLLIANKAGSTVMSVPTGTQNVIFAGIGTFPGLNVNGTIFSSAGLALMDDTDAAAQRATLGLAGVASSGSASDLTAGTLNRPVATTGSIVSSGAGVGYAAGAGGSVTQATSKSTAVTLNKACGQVTTHSAALANAAVVSFSVNNSQVEASDTINLNLRSGNAAAGAYRYWVEAVAAGYFRIVIENRSGGSLSEALVFNFAILKSAIA